MNIIITARKVLKQMEHYLFLETIHLPDFIEEINLGNQEEYLGAYINNHKDYVLVTSEKLHIVTKEKILDVNYSDILSAELLEDKYKTAVDTIILKLHSSEKIKLLIRHGKEKFRDVYEFLRFILRAIEYSNK